MAFIGNVPAESYITTVKDTFSGNGSTTAFTLSQPTVTNDVRVVVENVVQEPTTAYSVTGTTLTFTSAPPSGSNNVYVIHLGPAVQTTVPPETFGVGSIYGASDTDTAITFEGSGVTTFDQNGTEAARFDANGNLLVGTTDSNLTDDTTGGAIALQASGALTAARQDANPLYINRTGTVDGSIVDLRKAGATVGTIGVDFSDNLTIDAGAGNSGLNFATSQLAPYRGGNHADNAIDLGVSSIRWKDLYLSGGVYLGGTGSANYLGDYEEGSWSPAFALNDGPITYTTQSGRYVKIGKQVHLSGIITVSAINNTTDTSAVSIRVPFSPDLYTSSSTAHFTVITNDSDLIDFTSYTEGFSGAGETISNEGGAVLLDSDTGDFCRYPDCNSSGTIKFHVSYFTDE